MKIPLSWLKDFIDLNGLTAEEIARKLTLAGLEVDEILYAGLPIPVYKEGEKHEFKTNGIAWDKEKIVVAEIREVKAHPNADRLTLLDLFDGQQEQVVLTGAPNIFQAAMMVDVRAKNSIRPTAMAVLKNAFLKIAGCLPTKTNAQNSSSM